jgi:hypothetical protein
MRNDTPEKLGEKMAHEYGARPRDDRPTINIMQSAHSTYVVLQISRPGSSGACLAEFSQYDDVLHFVAGFQSAFSPFDLGICPKNKTAKPHDSTLV